MTYIDKEKLLEHLGKVLSTEITVPFTGRGYEEGAKDSYRGLIGLIEIGRFDVEASPEPIKLAVDGNIVATSFTGSSVTPINTLPHNYTKDVLEALLEASEDFYDASEIQAMLKGAIQAIPKGKGVIL